MYKKLLQINNKMEQSKKKLGKGTNRNSKQGWKSQLIYGKKCTKSLIIKNVSKND